MVVGGCWPAMQTIHPITDCRLMFNGVTAVMALCILQGGPPLQIPCQESNRHSGNLFPKRASKMNGSSAKKGLLRTIP